MSRIEDLAQAWERHIALPWSGAAAGAQRVIMVVYDEELERQLRARKAAFETAATRAGRAWAELDLAPAFAEWMARHEYREEYFAAPETLELNLRAEFPGYVAGLVRARLEAADANTVVALFGAGALFGFARVSHILGMIESAVAGRLVVFFPGRRDGNEYRLLDSRDGGNYLAVSIEAGGEGERT